MNKLLYNLDENTKKTLIECQQRFNVYLEEQKIKRLFKENAKKKANANKNTNEAANNEEIKDIVNKKNDEITNIFNNELANISNEEICDTNVTIKDDVDEHNENNNVGYYYQSEGEILGTINNYSYFTKKPALFFKKKYYADETVRLGIFISHPFENF